MEAFRKQSNTIEVVGKQSNKIEDVGKQIFEFKVLF